jgi:dTDP-4-dehydrorhamnose reductase
MNILVLGKNGQLGQSFQQLAKNVQIGHWTFVDKSILDLKDPDFRDQLSGYKFDILINCAAYTAVDKAETEIDIAYQINAIAVRQIAEVCLEKNALFIHFSTDYVYHNSIRQPLEEETPTLPEGIYAKSKLDGENHITASGCKYLIFRTSWVISPYGSNFVKTMLRLANTNHSLKIVSDQTGAPTLAEDLAAAVIHIIKLYQQNPSNFTHYGIYNYSNAGDVSWNELAIEIFRLSNLKIEVLPISTAEYKAPASRPLYSVLNTEKIRNTFGIIIPHWKDALQRCLNQLSLN